MKKLLLWVISVFSKKTLMTLVNQPYLNVDMDYVDGMIVMNIDYNEAMINKLDELGYDHIENPEEKVRAYAAMVYATMGEPEKDDEDEYAV